MIQQTGLKDLENGWGVQIKGQLGWGVMINMFVGNNINIDENDDFLSKGKTIN
jgi:hypothetical protein